MITALEITVLQWSVLSGGLIGAGVALLVAWLVPVKPDLLAALTVLNSETPRQRVVDKPANSFEDRLGRWIMRVLPSVALPSQDLDLLGVPAHRFLARKLVCGLAGCAMVAVTSAALIAVGARLPVTAPVGLSLALGLAGFFLPNLDVKSRAAHRREEFKYAFVVFIDLVATEQGAGTAPRQAMETAAESSDSWIFQRLSSELLHSKYEGITAWDAIGRLGEKIGLDDLTGFAATMRVCGDAGAAIHETLRAQAASMRQTRLAAAMAAANQTGERISAVVALLAIVCLGIVGAPAILTFLATT